ncbi:SLBB domain-containing protein [Streptococcus iniae]
MHEGVYHLKAGSRVTDLVQMAGGLSPEADRNALNLAEKLSDASMIYVAKKGEINSSELVLKAAKHLALISKTKKLILTRPVRRI